MISLSKAMGSITSTRKKMTFHQTEGVPEKWAEFGQTHGHREGFQVQEAASPKKMENIMKIL